MPTVLRKALSDLARAWAQVMPGASDHSELKQAQDGWWAVIDCGGPAIHYTADTPEGAVAGIVTKVKEYLARPGFVVAVKNGSNISKLEDELQHVGVLLYPEPKPPFDFEYCECGCKCNVTTDYLGAVWSVYVRIVDGKVPTTKGLELRKGHRSISAEKYLDTWEAVYQHILSQTDMGAVTINLQRYADYVVGMAAKKAGVDPARITYRLGLDRKGLSHEPKPTWTVKAGSDLPVASHDLKEAVDYALSLKTPDTKDKP